MTVSCCRITDTWCPKIALHDVRPTLGAPQIATNMPNHLMKVLGTLPTQGIGLYVLVEKLVRVQLRAVAGKKEQPNLVTVGFQPRL